ncbi:MAG: hypothetical protein ACD_49C00064G0016 [uncultured bacterium (gcode 4)]|uniref:Adenylate kinase n=1 Tax=uncultured bacterium (gcode 4) TaxID=1234023 RepID=K2BBI8_9BACT|nr:MAG: hypothetical protein ACD_49C00064G0016 [uncultured bacterium (gcode 4)]
MDIILVGIQWSGKWTQARKIVDNFSYSFFEMWQKLRNFCEIGHELSQDVREHINLWKLVPQDMIAKILSHYKETHRWVNILFDGIPRNIEQKDLFDEIIKDYIVIFLDLQKSDAIARLAGRRIDPITWESFSSDFTWDINPKTWNKLITRSDDTPEAVSKRVDIFYQNTLPLLALWAQEWRKVYKIDASKSIDEVFEEIRKILDWKK